MESKQKIGVVIKGYYQQLENTVFAIYLLDSQKCLMIPCSENTLNETESFDCLGDTASILQKQGYKLHFDIRKETEFDVTTRYPKLANK